MNEVIETLHKFTGQSKEQIKKELEKIAHKFKAIEIANCPKTTISTQGDFPDTSLSIKITTKRIYLKNDEKEYDIGQIVYYIPCNSEYYRNILLYSKQTKRDKYYCSTLGIYFQNITQNISSDSILYKPVFHPHIAVVTYACFGNLSVLIGMMLLNKQLLAACNVINNFLNTWNPEDDRANILIRLFPSATIIKEEQKASIN